MDDVSAGQPGNPVTQFVGASECARLSTCVHTFIKSFGHNTACESWPRTLRCIWYPRTAGPSTRRPAHSSKIQQACDRQVRLLEREAMIAKDLVTDVFIVTHSMRQISTLAHIEAVAPIKLISSSPSASDLNDWRMALQQGIRERRQVLREAHRLQRTELLQKLRDTCRERHG